MKNYSFKNTDINNKTKKNSKKNLTNIIQKHFKWKKKSTQIASHEDTTIISKYIFF